MTIKTKVTQNVLNAVDAVRASGAVVEETTVALMLLVDDETITEDEAIEIIINEESLSEINKPQ